MYTDSTSDLGCIIQIRVGVHFQIPFGLLVLLLLTVLSTKIEKKIFFCCKPQCAGKKQYYTKNCQNELKFALQIPYLLLHLRKKNNFFFSKMCPFFFVKLSFLIITKYFSITSFFILLEAYYVNISFKSSSFCGSQPFFLHFFVFSGALWFVPKKFIFFDFCTQNCME